MTYISAEWLGWIAGTTALFWAVPHAWRLHLLAAVTLAFLAIKAPESAILLIVLTVLTGLLTQGARLSGARTVLALAPAAASLVLFKLFSAAAGDDVVKGTLIPLGLSFYALRCMHFVLERYMERIAPKPLLEVAEYLCFLPTIAVGPIHRYAAFDRDRRRHRWDWPTFSEGLERILYGYVKIVFLGNFLINEVYRDWSTGIAPPDTQMGIYLSMLGAGFGLYMQFSGASDVAIGFARLLGFRIMENFAWPFLSPTLPVFWQRWHISLTSWAREYVYGGVSALSRSPALAAVATMVAIGLWHELSVRYVLWGVYHGLGIVTWQQLGKRIGPLPAGAPVLRAAANTAGTLLTLHFFMLGVLLVRQPDLAAMWRVLQTLLTGAG